MKTLLRLKSLTGAVALGAAALLSPITVQAAETAICYNCPPEWADWGSQLKVIQSRLNIQVPPDNKNSGQSIAAMIAEKANPVADVTYLGGISADTAKTAGILTAYKPKGWEKIPAELKDPDGQWFTIHSGTLGLFINKAALGKKPLPASWADLLKPEYKGLIWLSNYNTAGTAKLVINTMIQKYGHDEGIQYLVDLDKNIQVYTKSGSGPSKNVGTGECVIGIGFLHDGITQIVDNGYTNIQLIVPSSGTSFEIGATAIFKGAKHPNAAKLWVEYALSPECVELAAKNGSYQFLVIDNAKQPEQAAEFGLDPENVMDYDFEDAKNNIKTYVEEVMTALGGGDDRFKTE